MTGFGRAEEIAGGRDVTVEVRSVNHRFFDLSFRLPRGYGFLEEKLRDALKGRVARGKVDVSVDIEVLDDVSARVEVNRSLAGGYIAALRELQRQYGLKDDVTASSVARLPDVLLVRRAPENEEGVWGLVRPVLEKALEPFFAMRGAEGGRMRDDVLSRAGTILGLVEQIEERSPQTVEEYRRKLKERIADMLGGADADEQRILTEAAVFADKISVTEETVRLRSHLSQFSELLGAGGAIGRRLDFLVQEMNREANTIGSKCADAQIAHRVVDMNAEIENIREQIQNIE